MSEKDTGGPAFPQSEQVKNSTHPDYGLDCGMSLRDYFAAKALQGFCANPECISMSNDATVHSAYVLADAMLEARKP